MLDQLTKSLTTELYDSTGSLVERVEHETNSIVKPFAGILFTQLAFGNSDATITDISGTNQTVISSDESFAVSGTTGIGNRGVAFGSDDTAVSYDDNDLGSRFTSNISKTLSSAQITQTASQTDIELTQSTENTGTGDITAREAGLLVRGENRSNNDVVALGARDVLDTPQVIQPTDTLQGTYTFTFKL